ncbi:MAG: phosphoglycolate phosphatase [Planctomycetota bacterium]|jgi:phosphoglycolate phosphatase
MASMLQPLLFDAVIFDLDGTLVATDRYWIPAARSATRRALEEFGLELTIPETRAWLRIVGLPLDEGLASLFPSFDADQIQKLASYCLEEEQALVSSDGAAMLPGVREALDELQAAGIKIGIASNCGASYIEHVASSLGLAKWASEMRCLDSAGIRDKGDMIADLLLSFDTRRAVMVGDRFGDEQSARSNALPHIHVRTGYADVEEGATADLVLEDLSELSNGLRRRADRLSDVLDELGLNGQTSILGITGRRCSGKTFLAKDLAQLLNARGRATRVIALEDFRRTDNSVDGDSLGEGYDLDRLLADCIEPHRAGETGELLILEGSYLLDPRIATQLTRLLYLEVSREVAMFRFAGRDVRLRGPMALEQAREDLLAEERFESRFAPSRADLILSGASIF